MDIWRKQDITVEEITTRAMLQNLDMETENSDCNVLIDKTFITSPADVDTHRKVNLQDAEVLDKYKNEFEDDRLGFTVPSLCCRELGL